MTRVREMSPTTNLKNRDAERIDRLFANLFAELNLVSFAHVLRLPTYCILSALLDLYISLSLYFLFFENVASLSSSPHSLSCPQVAKLPFSFASFLSLRFCGQ